MSSQSKGVGPYPNNSVIRDKTVVVGNVSSPTTEGSINQFIDAQKRLLNWEKEHGLSVIENGVDLSYLQSKANADVSRPHVSFSDEVKTKDIKYVTETSPLGYFDSRASTSATSSVVDANTGKLIHPPLRTAITDANNIFPPTLNVTTPSPSIPSVPSDSIPADPSTIAAANTRLVDNILARSQVLPLRKEIQRLTRTNVALHTHLMEALAKQQHAEAHYQHQLTDLTEVHNELKFVYAQQQRKTSEMEKTITNYQTKIQDLLTAKSPQFKDTFDLSSTLTPSTTAIPLSQPIHTRTGPPQPDARVVGVLKTAQARVDALTKEVSLLRAARADGEVREAELSQRVSVQTAEIERLAALVERNVNWDKLQVELELEHNARTMVKLQRQVDLLNEERANTMQVIKKLGPAVVEAVAKGGGYTGRARSASVGRARSRSTSRTREESGSGRGDQENSGKEDNSGKDDTSRSMGAEWRRKREQQRESSIAERRLQAQVSTLTHEVKTLRQIVHERDKLRERGARDKTRITELEGKVRELGEAVEALVTARQEREVEMEGVIAEREEETSAWQQQAQQLQRERERLEQEVAVLQTLLTEARAEGDETLRACKEQTDAMRAETASAREEAVQARRQQAAAQRAREEVEVEVKKYAEEVVELRQRLEVAEANVRRGESERAAKVGEHTRTHNDTDTHTASEHPNEGVAPELLAATQMVHTLQEEVAAQNASLQRYVQAVEVLEDKCDEYQRHLQQYAATETPGSDRYAADASRTACADCASLRSECKSLRSECSVLHERVQVAEAASQEWQSRYSGITVDHDNIMRVLSQTAEHMAALEQAQRRVNARAEEEHRRACALEQQAEEEHRRAAQLQTQVSVLMRRCEELQGGADPSNAHTHTRTHTRTHNADADAHRAGDGDDNGTVLSRTQSSVEGATAPPMPHTHAPTLADAEALARADADSAGDRESRIRALAERAAALEREVAHMAAAAQAMAVREDAATRATAEAEARVRELSEELRACAEETEMVRAYTTRLCVERDDAVREAAQAGEERRAVETMLRELVRNAGVEVEEGAWTEDGWVPRDGGDGGAGGEYDYSNNHRDGNSAGSGHVDSNGSSRDGVLRSPAALQHAITLLQERLADAVRVCEAAQREKELARLSVEECKARLDETSDECERLRKDVVTLVASNRELRMLNTELFDAKCEAEEMRMIVAAQCERMEVELAALQSKYEMLRGRYLEKQVAEEEAELKRAIEARTQRG